MYCKCTAGCANCSASTGLLRGRSFQGADWGLLPRSHLHQRHSEIQKFGDVKCRLSMSLSNLVTNRSRLFCFNGSEKTWENNHQHPPAIWGRTKLLWRSKPLRQWDAWMLPGEGSAGGKSSQNMPKPKKKTTSDYFDVFWCHFEAEFVLKFLNIRDPCTAVEDSERWAATLFLQQWKQKCRSSELKDASLRRTFSNCNEMYALRHLLSTFGYWDRTLQCQVYPYGSYNCCRRPKGICRIRPGKASCCSWRHRPLQLGSQSEFLSFNEKLICGGSPT